MLAADHPLLALVSPPRVERFLALAEVEPDEKMSADFTGWSKLALLTRDRVFLFPRDHTLVEAMENEIEALRVFGPLGIAEIPALLGVWRDRGLGPYPIVAIGRLPGVTLEQRLPGISVSVMGEIAERIGTLAARWHTAAPGLLGSRPRRTLARPGLHVLLASALSEEEATRRVQHCLALGDRDAAKARKAIRTARTLPLVPIHGDIHEGQILVDPANDYRLTGLIDWQTAAVDHPFVEFDLGEWGPTLWREHRAEFPTLRQRYWCAYAEARGLDPGLELVFQWTHAAARVLHLADGATPEFDSTVVGTLEEARGTARAATARLSN